VKLAIARLIERPGAPVRRCTCCTCPLGRRTDDPHRPGGRVRMTVETCPHYLSFTAQAIADGATHSSAARRSARRTTGGAVAGAAAGATSTASSRTSALTPELKRPTRRVGAAWAGSRRCKVACPRCGPKGRQAATRCRRASGGWPNAPRSSPGCSAGPYRARLPGGLRRVRRRTRVRRRPRTAAPPQPRHPRSQRPLAGRRP